VGHNLSFSCLDGSTAKRFPVFGQKLTLPNSPRISQPSQ
jgi:hypothetical protein